MIKELIDSHDLVGAALLGLIWYGLTLATIQFIGKVLLVRIPGERLKRAGAGDWIFFAIFVVGIVSLTAFQGPLVSLLNEHPLLNLW
jgi:hypothetical protein